MTTTSPSSDTLRYPTPREGLPIPENEAGRLNAVMSLNQKHSESQPALIALRNTAQRLLKAPVAFIGMIEDETQRLLTVCIIPQEPDSAVNPVDVKEMVTPRDCSICQYTVMESDHLVIPDLNAFMAGETGKDYPEEFRQQALEIGGYPIPWPSPDGGMEFRPAHFYAGATIRTRDGLHVGTFCIVDVVPRPDFGTAEIQILESLAAQAAEYLEDRALLRFPANYQLLEQAGERDAHPGSDSGQDPSHLDAIILGGGPAGTTAACRLAFQGLDVALVEPRKRFGSPTGMNSKVLREVAMEHGAETTWEQVIAIGEMIGVRDGKRVATQLSRYGVSLIQGMGTLKSASAETGETQVEVSDETGKTRTLSARSMVLSTGSKARRLPGIPFDGQCIFDSDSINGLSGKPESLLIQGTGVIALEYATIFATMGVAVTVVSRKERSAILPNLDTSLKDALLGDLEARGVELLFGCNVEKWENEGGVAQLTLKQPSGSVVRQFTAAMSAVGRIPATENLGLENLTRTIDSTMAKAFETDTRMKIRGASSPVYAVGDLSGAGLACKAVGQAQQVVDDLLAQLVHGKKSGEPSPSANGPASAASVVWSIPELAFVGQTEQEARDAYGEDDVLSVITRFSDTIRGSLHALPPSYFLKLVCLKHDGRIMGVHIYGEGASELIHLGASLVAGGETVFKLQYRTFPAVTLHEIYRNGALQGIDALAESLQAEA